MYCDSTVKSGANAENTVAILVGEDIFCFAKEYLARIVVTKTCINKIDLLLAAGYRGEESGRSRCGPGDLPDFTFSKIVPNIVGFELRRKGANIRFCDGKNDPILSLDQTLRIIED